MSLSNGAFLPSALRILMAAFRTSGCCIASRCKASNESSSVSASSTCLLTSCAPVARKFSGRPSIATGCAVDSISGGGVKPFLRFGRMLSNTGNAARSVTGYTRPIGNFSIAGAGVNSSGVGRPYNDPHAQWCLPTNTLRISEGKAPLKGRTYMIVPCRPLISSLVSCQSMART